MRFRDFHRNIKIRLGIQFLVALASNTIFPFLAIYLASRVGAQWTGLMMMGIVVSGIAGGITGGFISDRLGRKKLMLISEAVMGVTFLGVALVNSPLVDSPYLTFLLLLVNMFFMGASEPASQAMVIDVSTPESRKPIFAAFYWIFNLAFAAGSLIGAFLFQEHRFELFLALAIILFVSVIVTRFFITETYRPSPAYHEPSASENKGALGYVLRGMLDMARNYRRVIRDRLFLMFMITGILITTLEFQLSNYIGIRLQRELEEETLFSLFSFSLDLDGFRMVGILQSENTLLVVLLMGLVGWATRHLPDRRVLYAGLLFYSAGYAVLGFAGSPWILIAAMFIATLGELMYAPIWQATLGNMAPVNSRSSYLALNGMTHQLAMLMGGVFVIVGEYLSAMVISGIYFLMGLIGMGLASRIMSGMQQRVQSEADTEVPVT
ncbi:MAG: MFS transporter [Bacillaceae bacterium]|nr:MFS transporter [Bacillaceae bacterium]